MTNVRSRTMPALLTRMSIDPKVSTAWATMRPAPSKSATDSPLATAFPPASSMSRQVSAAGPWAVPAPSSVVPRSFTTTLRAL